MSDEQKVNIAKAAGELLAGCMAETGSDHTPGRLAWLTEAVLETLTDPDRVLAARLLREILADNETK